MKNPPQKRFDLVFFILGTLFGIILGVAITIWVVDHFGNAPDFLSFTEQAGNTPSLTDRTAPGNVDKKASESMDDTIGFDEVTVDPADSAADGDLLTGQPDTTFDVIFPEVRNNEFEMKSLRTDSLDNGQDAVVLRDQKVFSRTIDVRGKDTLSQGKNIDSLLFDNPYPPTTPQNKVVVEFWRSPVNYEGYKLSGKRLILFGLNEFDSVFLYREGQNKLRMYYLGDQYLLERSDDFLPYITTKPKKKPKE